MFAALPRVRQLQLYDNRLTSIAPYAFSGLLELEQLDLDGGTPSNTWLPRQFATAFSRRDFEATRIAKELRSWESLGHAFRVLPREGDEAPAH